MQDFLLRYTLTLISLLVIKIHSKLSKHFDHYRPDKKRTKTNNTLHIVIFDLCLCDRGKVGLIALH